MSFQDFGKPRRVEGGLRARSARGAIGESWWSRRFLDVLESFALGTRLTRGRSYARAGQVLALDVAAGTVTASVQGSRATPYQVAIGFPALPDPVWSQVEHALAAQALYCAQLLAGEMPPEIEDVFAAADAALFPASFGELRLSCSCPDWSVPCKHLAATFYLLAETFDADPFQILRWRGRDRETLLARLRTLRATADSSGRAGEGTVGDGDGTVGGGDRAVRDGDAAARPRSGPGAEAKKPARPEIGSHAALGHLASPTLDEMLDRFWVSPVPLPVRPPTLDTEPDLLLRQLPPPGARLGGPDLVERLRAAYERFAE